MLAFKLSQQATNKLGIVLNRKRMVFVFIHLMTTSSVTSCQAVGVVFVHARVAQVRPHGRCAINKVAPKKKQKKKQILCCLGGGRLFE